MTKSHWGTILPYAVGGLTLLLAAAAGLAGAPWYVAFGIVCAAFIIMLSQRRILRPAAIRAAGEVVCRYFPWYEGNAYLMCVLIPLAGVATTAAGYDPNSASAVTLSFSLIGSRPIEIRREWVESISAKMVPDEVRGKSPQVEIAYRATEAGSDDVETVVFGLWLTVRPANLLDALVAWKDGAGEDPNALLDRLEQLLLGGQPRPAP